MAPQDIAFGADTECLAAKKGTNAESWDVFRFSAKYQANEHALLCQLFDITGQAKASSRSLRDGVAVLGRNLDLATAVARHEARAWHSGVKPPSALIDLVKGESGYWEVEPKAPAPTQKRGEYDYVTLPPAEEELVDQTIDPSADFDPEAVS